MDSNHAFQVLWENFMNNNQIVQVDFKSPKILKTFNYAGGHFNLTTSGVYFLGKDKSGNEIAPRWICSPLHVIAKTRNSNSGEWGRLLEWIDDDKVKHQWAMPLALLTGDSLDVLRELARLGLAISPSKGARDFLTSYIQVFPIEARAKCIDKLGWDGDCFITPSETIGSTNEKVVYQNTNSVEPAYHVAGTVKDWRDSIARLAYGNSRLMFSISCAFAPTLAAILGESSGGFHLCGSSSSGKSTALKTAASVWGPPETYSRLWRSTANGLEGLASIHNDGLLILDELSQMDPKEAGECACLLANGQGKTRALKCGAARQSNRWRLFFLSAGEESLSALMAKVGQRCNAGQEIRLADFEADAGKNMGIFETLYDGFSPAKMAVRLNDATNRYHGAVGKEWLNTVVMNKKKLLTTLPDEVNQFIDDVTSIKHSGQVHRVARRFAIVAAAGELASQHGLTGWPQGEASLAVALCFHSWLDGFGGNGSREERAILSQVRSFFELNGASRFDSVNNPNNERIKQRAGFYKTDETGHRIFLVMSEVYRKEICKGFEPRLVTRTLLANGWITPGRDGNSSQKPRIKGVGIPRVYVFNKKLWED